MKEILIGSIGLIGLALSGLTYIAYKHPVGYRKIYSILMLISGVVSLFFLSGNFAVVYTSIRSLGEKQLPLDASQKLEVVITSMDITSLNSDITSLNEGLDFILWTVFAGALVMGYLFFLYKLPVILQIKDT